MNPDLTYTQDGLFTRFMPETPQGIEAYNTMAEHQSPPVFLNLIAPQVIKQLRDAGYTVRKAPKPKPITPEEIDKLMEELES